MSRRRARSRSVSVELGRLLVDAGRWAGHAAIRLARWSGKTIRRQAKRWYAAERAARRRRQAERRAAQRAQRATAPRPARPRQRPARAARPPDLLAQLLDSPPGDTLADRLLNSRPQTPEEAVLWAEYIGRHRPKRRSPRRKKPIAVSEYAKSDGTKVSSHRRATPGQGG